MPSPTPRPHGFAVGRIEHGSQTRHSVAQAYSRVLAASRVLGAARAAVPHPWIERLLKKPRRRFLQHAYLKRLKKRNRAVRRPTRQSALSRCGLWMSRRPSRIPNRWGSGYDRRTEKLFRHTPIHCGRYGGRPTEHTPIPLTATFHKWYERRTRKAGEHKRAKPWLTLG